MKLEPPPPCPLGAILRFFSFFYLNFRRRSVRVLKLHRGFILTIKGDIQLPTNSETPLAERRVSRAQTQERGPPLALADFFLYRWSEQSECAALQLSQHSGRY
jgi:hypothetical protein